MGSKDIDIFKRMHEKLRHYQGFQANIKGSFCTVVTCTKKKGVMVIKEVGYSLNPTSTGVEVVVCGPGGGGYIVPPLNISAPGRARGLNLKGLFHCN